MRKNRLIALVTILTLTITSGLGNLGLLLSSYAQDKSNLIIADIFNEEPIPTPDNKLLLDQNIEKVSDTELKINLNIKSLSESIDLKNVILVNTLSDNLEINSDSVSVIGIENEKDAKGEVTQPRDTVTVELGDVSSDEVNVSFLAKIRQSATAGENIALNLNAELKYSLDTEEEGVYNFAIPKFNLIENVVEEEVKEEDLSVGEEAVTDDKLALPEVSSQSTVVNPTPEPNPGTVTKPSLETHKKAEDNGDGTFKITLEVKGKPTVVEPKKADIVMVLDTSGSMIDKLENVKTAAKKFSENILDSTTENQVRISIARFDCGDPNVSEENSSIMLDFNSNINDIKNTIDKIGDPYNPIGGGTHTQEGILRATELIDKSKNDNIAENRYVLFFTDGVPNESYSSQYYFTGHDVVFKDAQRAYYTSFIGYGAPNQVSIGGIGGCYPHELDPNTGKPPPETITVSTNPTYKDVKFYSLGLFTDDPQASSESNRLEKEKAQAFMPTIQNVIDPSQYLDKYYTEDLSSINSIFMDISNEIKGEINSTIVTDLVIHDIVTKEFKIKDGSWKLTDLKNNDITIPPGSVTVSKTSDGCDEVTIRVGDLIANQVDSSGNPIGGVRFSFDVETTDPYFSGDNIKTNVGADINYKDPTTNSESSEAFKEDPTVNISPKKGKVKVTKNVKNSLGQIIADDTPFEIVIERVIYTTDPAGIVPYNKTYKLKSKDFNDTGELHLIGPHTVSPDGKVILSTVVADADKYLVAGDYTVKEINIPSNYALQEIKVNGTVINKGSTFNLSKDNKNIDIEVVNKNTISNSLIKEKTATPVKDKAGNPTGEFEIALKVSTPKPQFTTLMYDNSIIKYHSQPGSQWQKRTVGTSQSNKSYMVTNTNGNSITFEFEGTGFEWIAQGNSGEYIDRALIRIDGDIAGEEVPTHKFTSNNMEQTIYRKRGLTPGKHTVNISFWKSDNNTRNILSIRKLLIYKDNTPNITIPNATITDIVTEPFNIIMDGYGPGKTAVIEKPSGSPAVDIATTVGKKTINNKTYDSLTWSPINIDSNGVTIKFKVKPKDIYQGQNNVDTNVEATVEYKDGNTTNKEYFNKPKVDIPFIKGSITIRKDIVHKNNAGIWETIPNNKVNPNDKFSISIVGDQTYTVDLAGNTKQTLNFYLKDTSTNISYNPDTTLNYITKGAYSVKEILPMNYEQVDVFINTSKPLNTDNPTWVNLKDYSKDGKFIIDKDNPNIDIKVTNTLVNDSYYQDKSNASNIFKYHGVTPLKKLFEKFN